MNYVIKRDLEFLDEVINTPPLDIQVSVQSFTMWTMWKNMKDLRYNLFTAPQVIEKQSYSVV